MSTSGYDHGNHFLELFRGPKFQTTKNIVSQKSICSNTVIIVPYFNTGFFVIVLLSLVPCYLVTILPILLSFICATKGPLHQPPIHKPEVTNCPTDVFCLVFVVLDFSHLILIGSLSFKNEILYNSGFVLSWKIEIPKNIGPAFQHNSWLKLNSCYLFRKSHAHSSIRCLLHQPVWFTILTAKSF